MNSCVKSVEEVMMGRIECLIEYCEIDFALAV